MYAYLLLWQNVYVLETKGSTTAMARIMCLAAVLYGLAIYTARTWVVIATSPESLGATSRATRAFVQTSSVIQPTHSGLRICTACNCVTVLMLVVRTQNSIMRARESVRNQEVTLKTGSARVILVCLVKAISTSTK